MEKLLVAGGLRGGAADIGVVTPYNGQVGLPGGQARHLPCLSSLWA